MGRRLEYEVKTSVRLNMSNPQHVKINDVIQNLDPKIFKSKNQFIIDAIQFYIDNYGKETFVIKKKEKRGLNISAQKILMTLRKKSLKQQPMRLGKRS